MTLTPRSFGSQTTVDCPGMWRLRNLLCTRRLARFTMTVLECAIGQRFQSSTAVLHTVFRLPYRSSECAETALSCKNRHQESPDLCLQPRAVVGQHLRVGEQLTRSRAGLRCAALHVGYARSHSAGPVCASWILEEISCVTAPCSSTAHKIADQELSSTAAWAKRVTHQQRDHEQHSLNEALRVVREIEHCQSVD